MRPATTLPRWFESRVRQTPSAPALLFADRTLAYRELNARANRLARRLIALGVGPERVAGVLLPRSDLLVIAFLAVLKAGGTYLPIDPELPRQRISYVVADAAPVTVLTTASLAEALPGQVPTLLLDADGHGDAGENDVLDQERLAPLTPATATYLLYTSGSTGRPKGVTMCGGAIVNLLTWHLRTLPIAAGEVTVQFTPLSFDIWVQEVLSTLLGGALLAIPPDEVRVDPAALVRWIDQHGVTHLFGPNVVIEAASKAAYELGLSLPSLAHVVQGGEPLVLGDKLRALFRTQPGRRLHNHYGPTETHVATSHPLPAGCDDWAEPVPIGKPIWNTRVYLLDQALTPVTPGVAGEIYIAGKCLARGYHGQPAQTAERFLPDPFGTPGSRMYRTGDLARWRPGGVIDYLGRIDHQVKIRGVRVELGEVEAAIRRVPETEAAVVVAVGDGSQRRLDAYLVCAPGAAAEEVVADKIREALRGTLPAVMVPSTFTVLKSLPLSPNGKIDRLALPSPSHRLRDDTDSPRTLQEQALGRIFAAVLGVDSVGIHDSFYELGGHSLLAAELAGRVRAELGIELSIADVLRFPSVARLAASLASGDTDRPALRRQVRPSPLPASDAQRRLWILDRLDGPSPRYNELLALRLAGKVDRPALRRALTDLVSRHEALRTVLLAVDGEPVQQVVQPDAGWPPMAELDASAAPVDDLIRQAVRQPFDLAAEPPVRAWLVRLEPGQHLLVMVIHHIACDGMSMGPLVRDLAMAYDARLAGRTPVWSPAPIQYADYALWQRQLLGTPDEPTPLARRQSSFWARTLAGMPAVTPLPPDRPRPAVRGSAGRRLRFTISSALHERLAELGRRHQATVFMVVHAALVALIRRRGGGDDVAIGTVVSGRGDGALNDLVGFFVNTLVLRVNAGGDLPFGELLDRTRDADLDALAHQDLPFDWVVEIANPARSLAHHPLVQVLLAFQVDDSAPARFSGLTVTHEPVDPEVAKFDLCISATERFTPEGAHAGLDGWLDYATDIFDAATADGMLTELLDLLTSVAGTAVAGTG